MNYVLGQRWVSQTESELGLGIIVAIEGRHVTVRFPAAEEDRVYAQNDAPLARVIYRVGDTLHDTEQALLNVIGVEDLDGLKCYLVANETGAERLLPETQISGLIQLSSPRQRLFSGQFDKGGEYELRVAALHHRYRVEQSPGRGLLGARTSLLPHQVYIAHEVATRYAPRVLLADEVGLGKTIEAGMILHHQLQTGLASRALIVVPDALLHQWLVEMLRKFNLRFALYDRPRVDALKESGEENPFEAEQLILCGLDLLLDEHTLADATSAGWDLLIVDEAHHLKWHPNTASPQYVAIEHLARVCAGLLLLTATPEQLGLDGHFARLRLLDPARFSDLDTFKSEQASYVALNHVVTALNSGATLTSTDRALVAQFADIDELASATPADLVEQLLDRHGTGRVLFRNTRAAIKGFPKRELTSYALVNPFDPPLSNLYPEHELRQRDANWIEQDPRVSWLELFLREHRAHKVLLICASAETALDLESHLHLNVGVRSAAFYEGLSIVERDRAAAYFADDDGGAQVLICSEIGSEGRNFQFAHHLVLFDLPLNPDLLEQRIGRLDRIGQTEDIKIHVPYIMGSAQEVLFKWFHEGLNAFERSFSAGSVVKDEVASLLNDALAPPGVTNDALVRDLVAATASIADRLRDELEHGRDRLLELNSCRPEVAAQTIAAISELEQSTLLRDYMTEVFEIFGVEYEPHSEEALILRPTDVMLTHSFPHLSDEGLTVTFDRAQALAREDMEFLSWEAPLVQGVNDMLLGGELGNTAISSIKLKGIPAGTILVECYYVMQVSAPKKYQVTRFLPPAPVRLLMDDAGRDLTAVVTHEQLNRLCEKIRKSARMAIIKQIRDGLEKILNNVERTILTQQDALKATARDAVADVIGEEIERLEHLRQINPSIREEELAFFYAQRDSAIEYIDQAFLDFQAVRVIITI